MPGLFKCWRKGNVGIINAPGTGIADDKAIYSYVDKMIKFYLDEEPKLKQVQTFLCRKKVWCFFPHVLIRENFREGG